MDEVMRRIGSSVLRRVRVLILLVIITVSSLVVLTQAIVIVPAGRRGILLTWGKVTGVLGEGFHFITPISQKVVEMDVTILKSEASESTASADLQQVTTTLAVNYRLDPSYVGEIYTNFRQYYVSRVITPNIEESIKATTALFKAEELITKRAEVKIKFDEILTERLRPFHIDVLAVSITDFQFSEEFSNAIEAKVVAEQKALEAKNKLEQIRYEAQQQVIQAEAYYNATIITAQADSEALRLRREQLDPLILQWLALEKWNGVLPYFFGGEVVPFLQIPSNSTG